jgi:NB-ARC domain.
MGGTGKTVTAVAAVQDDQVRQHYSDIYWLTVGADAVGEKIKQLQGALFEQLAGKNAQAEQKSEQELQQMLVEAMAEKKQALVVLDDPWMPEQVRFLNPIDGSGTNHRMLVTTRIRDLVPKATRVELPLMGKNEAVALLMDLANVDEAEYRKDNPDSSWPPQAAYTIAAECGLLPITLTIAAQVVRSWGDGWGEWPRSAFDDCLVTDTRIVCRVQCTAVAARRARWR